MFNAGDEEWWKAITRTTDDCDYCVLIIAHRYGSKKNGKSYAQMEYEYVVSKNIPILVFMVHEEVLWPDNNRDITKIDLTIQSHDG